MTLIFVPICLILQGILIVDDICWTMQLQVTLIFGRIYWMLLVTLIFGRVYWMLLVTLIFGRIYWMLLVTLIFVQMCSILMMKLIFDWICLSMQETVTFDELCQILVATLIHHYLIFLLPRLIMQNIFIKIFYFVRFILHNIKYINEINSNVEEKCTTHTPTLNDSPF